jgi:hypothetical protein
MDKFLRPPGARPAVSLARERSKAQGKKEIVSTPTLLKEMTMKPTSKYVRIGLLICIVLAVMAIAVLQPRIWQGLFGRNHPPEPTQALSSTSTLFASPAATDIPTVAAVQEISFSDVIPQDLHFREGWCWNSIGVDDKGNVYMGIGGKTLDGQDVVEVSNNITTGVRKFLTTLRTVSQQAGNLKTGEEIPKGHTRIVEMNGKMYLGSQGFHDIFAIDPNVRGGHFYEMDVTSGTWRDLSVTDPGGVSIPNQGIIGVDVIPEKNMVVGFASPAGNIVVYDLASQHSTVYTNPDAAQYLGRNVSRHIVYSSKYNRIYTSFAGSPMLRLDLNTGAYTTLPASSGEFYFGPGPGYDYGNEFVTAMAKNHDGSQIYYLSWNGYLYHFNVDNETLTRVGPINTADEIALGVHVQSAFALAMSKDEKYLYTIPSGMSDGYTGLYRYDIAAGVWSKIADFTDRLGGATFAGGETDAAGRIYFARFGDESSGWVHLLQIDVNQIAP